jgi:hypothetical protein
MGAQRLFAPRAEKQQNKRPNCSATEIGRFIASSQDANDLADVHRRNMPGLVTLQECLKGALAIEILDTSELGFAGRGASRPVSRRFVPGLRFRR